MYIDSWLRNFSYRSLQRKWSVDGHGPCVAAEPGRAPVSGNVFMRSLCARILGFCSDPVTPKSLSRQEKQTKFLMHMRLQQQVLNSVPQKNSINLTRNLQKCKFSCSLDLLKQKFQEQIRVIFVSTSLPGDSNVVLQARGGLTDLGESRWGDQNSDGGRLKARMERLRAGKETNRARDKFGESGSIGAGLLSHRGMQTVSWKPGCSLTS